MTREEAWRRTKGYLYDVLSGEEADEIIKALEQEPKTDVLDKIRAEIIEMRRRQNVGVLECLDIIDKHISESEDKK